ncbi:MAG TPA: LysR family transcriptional regulator [Steroidobacteraceae bacterium]
MRLHHLTALVAIAEQGSFTAAAVALEISQSSLSHAVADLEDELGVSLLVRGRHGARLTEVGGRAVMHARQAIAAMESIRGEAASARGMLAGRLRIGSIPSAGVALLPKVVAHLSRQHPGIEVVLFEEPSQGMHQLLEWLRNGTIDVAVVELPLAQVKTVPLLDDEYCAIVAASSPLAKRRHISIRDLAMEPFVTSRYVSERLVRPAFAAQGVAPNVKFDVQDLATLVSLVREGLGVSAVPRIAFPETPPGVVLLPLLPRIRRQLGLAINPADHRSPAQSAFMSALQQLSAGSRR